MERNLDNSYQNKLTRSCSDDLHYSNDPQLNFHDTSVHVHITPALTLNET
jgi:hypothetical protein